MITFPNCKINLGLRILRKRSDGYHDLETVFYPLSFYDVLEVVRGNSSFTTSGLSLNGNTTDNLCLKAYELLKKDFPSLPSLQIYLHKNIPIGAGLGGGSADAAFTLQLLNKKFSLGLSNESLLQYALQLGSDCPFFIVNKPSFAGSRGEELLPVQVDLSSYNIILVNPGIQVSTAKAFSGIVPAVPVKSVKDIVQQPISTWKEELVNDFETTTFPQYPEIQKIKEELYNKGAFYAAMSGSGSSVYGIFLKEKEVQLSFPGSYMVKQKL
jgi:4-diphosphocytidyl-2-C-methyl-D-erythritol kinase